MNNILTANFNPPDPKISGFVKGGYATICLKPSRDFGIQGLSQARSKPDPVDRVQTAHCIGVHMMCTIMMHNSTEVTELVK